MHFFMLFFKMIAKRMFCDFYAMSGSILEYSLVLTISRYKPFLILHGIFDISTCDVSSKAEQHGLHIKKHQALHRSVCYCFRGCIFCVHIWFA